jgi:hypothetical protein
MDRSVEFPGVIKQCYQTSYSLDNIIGNESDKHDHKLSADVYSSLNSFEEVMNALLMNEHKNTQVM